MTAQSLDISVLKKSCILIASPDGRMMPFEACNIFYCGERQAELAAIRAEIDAQREQRLHIRPKAVPLMRA